MPEFVLICRDKDAHFELRAATRSDHLTYIKEAGDRVLLAGPILDNEGRPVGSILTIKAENDSDARRFAEGDPYANAGLFAETQIHLFKIVTGALTEKSG
jgi:uncharacterized protein